MGTQKPPQTNASWKQKLNKLQSISEQNVHRFIFDLPIHYDLYLLFISMSKS